MTDAAVDRVLAAELLSQARADRDSVLELAAKLIRVPSRGGVDSYEPVLAVLEGWFTGRGMSARRLHDGSGALVGLVAEVDGGLPGPTWVLDACVDTAPLGDESLWSFPPFAGDIESGWLRGRGSADSKAAAAAFCHIAARLQARGASFPGRLAVLLDCDEHTGTFGGALAYLSQLGDQTVGGVMIGYPGLDELVVGGRGVYRARLRVSGTAAHSGSSKPAAANAAVRAAWLVGRLSELGLPQPSAGGFPLPPKLTVTEISAGGGFTTVPDTACVAVDIRLTDTLASDDAELLLKEVCTRLDRDMPGPEATRIEPVVSWPPFRLGEGEQPAQALRDAALQVGLPVRSKVAGPSNIGNLLAKSGIRATAGFGPHYEGLHGTDERIRVAELPQVQAAYHLAVLHLLGVAETQH
ncbi:M20 family metallopeptidase [Kitasatospora sp. NPDC001261]|uniref:M20 family metallopeptidase n=1 Tax=Kitasatospora sp. NPDC001261 TaxID=3364012 RepID=UPI0036B2E3AD